MKRQLTGALVFILILGYTALVSATLCNKVAAQETSDYITAFDFNAVIGKYATAHSSDWTVRIWDADSDQLLRMIQVPDLRRSSIALSSIRRIVFSSSGDSLAISLWGDILHGLILIVDTSTGETLLEISDVPSVDTIDWSPDGNFLAGFYDYYPFTEGWSNFLALWDAQTGEKLNQYLVGNESPRSLDWHPSEARLAFPISTRGVVVWDIEGWKELYTLNADAEGVTSIAWNPAGDRLASVGVEGAVRIWDGSTDKLLREIKMNAFEKAYPAVFWSQDGKWVGATAGNRVEAWDVETGKAAFSKEVSQQVTGAALRPDGRLIVTSQGVTTLETPLSQTPRQ